MKTTVYTRVALLALALAASSPTAFAQTVPAPALTPTTPSTPVPPAAPVLTADEKAHLDKVRTEALATNPDLKTEADSLKAQHQAMKAGGTAASTDDKQAFKVAKKAHEQKLQTAMLKIDPTVAPILAKIKAAHKEKKNA
jgi:hypothetical protein